MHMQSSLAVLVLARRHGGLLPGLRRAGGQPRKPRRGNDARRDDGGGRQLSALLQRSLDLPPVTAEAASMA